MSVEGMQGLHGGIGADKDGAVGASEEEVRGRGGVREGELVGLDVLRLRRLSNGSRCGVDGDKVVILRNSILSIQPRLQEYPGGSLPFFRPSPPRHLRSSRLSIPLLPMVRPLCRSCSSRPRICKCHRCSHWLVRPPWSDSKRPFQWLQYGLEALCCSSPAAYPGSIYEACGLLNPWRSDSLLGSMRSSES